MKKWCFPLDVCKKESKQVVPTDFDFVEPFIGPGKVIENPQLRSRGNIAVCLRARGGEDFARTRCLQGTGFGKGGEDLTRGPSKLASDTGGLGAAATPLLGMLIVRQPIQKDMSPQQGAAFLVWLIAVRLGLAKADMFDAEATNSVKQLLGLLPQCASSGTATESDGSFAAALGIALPSSKIALMLTEAMTAFH